MGSLMNLLELIGVIVERLGQSAHHSETILSHRMTVGQIGSRSRARLISA
jgi:hypothetical protein